MLVVVGGHSRNIGKTSVVAGLIAALPQWNWTALKITQFGHGICATSGEDCDCCLAPEHAFAISEERQAGRSDSGRFLAAGARKAYWLRTPLGQLGAALAAFEQVWAASQNLIVESNSIMEFVRPELYLVVLDFAQRDFKASSARYLERADACVVIERPGRKPAWKEVEGTPWREKPCFWVRPPRYVRADLSAFVNQQLTRCRDGASFT
jgi:hypothetical protein